jgi:hypothetical protein
VLSKCRSRLRWKHLHGRVLLLVLLMLLVLLVLLNMVLWLNMMLLLRLRLLKLLMVLQRDRCCDGGGGGGRRIAAKLFGHLAHDARERRVRRPRAHSQIGMPDNVERRRRGQPRVLQTRVAEQQRGRRLGEGGPELDDDKERAKPIVDRQSEFRLLRIKLLDAAMLVEQGVDLLPPPEQETGDERK